MTFDEKRVSNAWRPLARGNVSRRFTAAIALSSSSTTKPDTPFSITSGTDPRLNAITGVPQAMACGTPVIAFNRGSVPEVIENGVSGFVVEDELSAIAAVKRLDTLPRAKGRQAFETRFSSKVMAARYV